MPDLPASEAEWLRRWGRSWLGLLDRPVFLPEPGDLEWVEVEIYAPDGSRFDVGVLRAAHVGQAATAVPLGGRFAAVAGTVTAVEVDDGGRSATLTVRIDDVPAWRAALPPEEPFRQ